MKNGRYTCSLHRPCNSGNCTFAKERQYQAGDHYTEDFQQHIGDILAIYIELDKEARQYYKCLCKPSTAEHLEGIAKLSDFLNKSEHKDAARLN